MNPYIKTSAIFVILITAFTLAASTLAYGQDIAHRRALRLETVRRNMLAGPVSPAGKSSYQIGKDFAMAIDDSQTMKQSDESFNYTIVDLVYLIDEPEGQAEAAQLQAILKGVVRGSKDLTAVTREIAAISTTFLSRQAAEQKWYFNVGASQMNLMIAGWSKDPVAASKNMKDLQLLTRTAPSGTPSIVLEAIKGLAKYSTMAQLTVNDFSDLVTDAKLITTLVYA